MPAIKIGICGHGVVGKHMVEDCRRVGINPVIYDKFQPGLGGDRWEQVNECDAVFVCVSTPQAPDGTADLSAIWDVFTCLKGPVAIIRSTILPGTTDRLVGQGHAVVFCPEFIGEGVNPPYSAMQQPPFLILGGNSENRARAAAALNRLYNSECGLVLCTALEAEIAKYAENYFLAMKVTWANELYEICEQMGADYVAMMGALTHDYRIGKSHTHVYPDDRGWGGRCLPKDTSALLNFLGGEEYAPLLAAVRRINELQRGGKP